MESREPNTELRLLGNSLQDNTIPLGQFAQLFQLFLVDSLALLALPVNANLKAQPDGFEPNRRLPVHPHGAPEIQISFGPDRPRDNGDPQRRRHGLERDPRTRHQRLQQHVPRTQLAGHGKVVAAGCWMQARNLLLRLVHGFARRQLAGYAAVVEGAG